MIRPTFPGFTAESALVIVRGPYKRSVSFGGDTELTVVPALPPRDSDTPSDKRIDCILACRESGIGAAECSRRCNSAGSSPGYQCTMQDNSYNHALCIGGMWTWEIACVSECSLLNSVPGVGAGLAAACGAGCHALGEQMRSTCPPSTICV